MRVLNEEKLTEMADFIRQYSHDNNRMPVLSETMNHMNMTKSVAYRYLMKLKERGIVEYNGKGTLEMESLYTKKIAYRRVPLLGQIVCGSPEDEEEYAEDYLALPEEWVDGDCFLLRTYGDSMVDVGIERNDLVLVKKTSNAHSGQIVVALTENGNTLKRIFWENGKPRLHAENQDYSPEERDIYPQQLSIQGVALKVIRNLK